MIEKNHKILPIPLVLLFVVITYGLFGLSTQKAIAAFSAVTNRGSTELGTGNNTSINVVPTGTIAVGKIAFFAVVTDNEGTTDGCGGTLHQFSGTAGNTWVKVFECTETDGSSDDGVTVSFYWTYVGTAITTSDTITVNFNTGRSDIIGMLFEVTVGAGQTVAVETTGFGQNTLTAAVSSMASRPSYFMVYFAGAEGEDNTKTQSTNYTELFDLWSTNSGQAASNVSSYIQTRIAQITSDSVTPSAWTFTNPFSSLTAFYEIVLAVSPTVQTNAATNVTPRSATLNGQITATGGSNSTVRGFAWGTNSALSGGNTATTTETGSFGISSFSQNVSTLQSGVTYYFRAYATNPNGTGYGTILNFTTGTDTTSSRKLRLFEGFSVKFLDGKIILHQN